MLFEVSIGRLYRFTAEFKHRIAYFFHPVLKRLEQLTQILFRINPRYFSRFQTRRTVPGMDGHFDAATFGIRAAAL
jgi:hypothetical protein